MKNKIIKINSLSKPLNFFSVKTWIVLTVAKADVKPYFSKKVFEKLDDCDMSYIADKLADALLDINYWDCLQIICKDYEKKGLSGSPNLYRKFGLPK